MGYCFVSNDEAGRKLKVRSHLRELQAAKKGHPRGTKQDSLALRRTSVTAGGSLTWGRKSDFGVDQASPPQEQNDQSADAPGRSQPQFSPSSIRGLHAINSPLGILSQGRTDPFTTYPIAWDPEIDQLFDNANQTLGSSMFNYTTNDSFDIYRNICSIAMTDSAAFQTLMVLVSSQRDRLAGRTIPSSRTLHHRLEAVHLVNERFVTDPNDSDLTEGFMFAVMALTGIQGAYNAVGTSPQTPGLQQLILRKGGVKGLHNTYPVLEFLTYGLALFSPMLRPGCPSLYDSSQQPYSPLHETLALVKELLEFLTQINTTYHVEGKRIHPFVASLAFAFGPGTPMYQLLTAPLPIPSIPLARQAYVQNRMNRSMTTYVLCVLLSLNPVVHHNVGFQAFVLHLRSILSRTWIWQRSSRMLQWFLLRTAKAGPDMLDRPAAAWKSFRLVHAIALLEEGTQMRVQRYLIRVLAGTDRTTKDEQGILLPTDREDDGEIDMGKEQIERIRLEVVEMVKRQHANGKSSQPRQTEKTGREDRLR